MTIEIKGNWSILPLFQAIWSVDNIDLVAPAYKIISITEKGGLTYEITALQHESGKFATIDDGTRIEPAPHTGLDSAPGTPANLLFSTHPYWVDDYDATGTLVLDGKENSISTMHDFSVDDSARKRHAVTETAPENATHALARFVWVDVTDAMVGCRQIKVERGELPATPYSIEGTLTSSFAAIQTETNARVTAVNAVASSVSTLQTQLNGNTASIQTQALSIDGLSAQYTVKTDVNGYVAGYGLATTIVDGIPQSDFTILADRFAVVQNGIEKRVPFVVTSKNDVAQIGIDGNLLVNGSVTSDALIANSITGDKIKAGTVSANVFNSGIGSGSPSMNFLPLQRI